MNHYDVVIVGGGIVGMSVAYHLLRLAPATKVLVLEKEESPGLGATSKATGGIRHTFSTAVNVQLTQLSLPEYLRFPDEFGVDMGLIQNGYLFVTGKPEQLAIMRQNVTMQNGLGVPSQLVGPADLARLLPGMATGDLLGGTLCMADGSGDPYSAMSGYWHRMRELGGELRTEVTVTGLKREGDRIVGVEVGAGVIPCGAVVNCAGPFAGAIGAMAGVQVPVQPYKRSVYVAKPMAEFGKVMPLTVDMDTGWYVHRDNRSGHLLLGGTDKVSTPGFSTVVDWEGQVRVLEAGVKRFPALAEAEVYRAYAGLREITPDFHAILGPAPEVPNLYLACGFSGHGFMHAPAAGILTAELITGGAAKSLDITPLRLERFASGQVHEEKASF